jgi:hypothetical protein
MKPSRQMSLLLKIEISQRFGLQAHKDFNFYFFPRSIAFRTDMNRYYNE